MRYSMPKSNERDEILSQLLRERLAPYGFVEQRDRVWVADAILQVRRLFEMQSNKGSDLAPIWGFSLDFVPHRERGSWVFHSNAKSACLDIIIDPKALSEPPFLNGRMDRLLDAAVFWAWETWGRVNSLPDLLPLIEEIETSATNRFGFSNYTQMPLAKMFVESKCGRTDSARATFEQYQSDWPDPDGLWRILNGMGK
jgi:hypothetical protein